jgi:hypothetical protein
MLYQLCRKANELALKDPGPGDPRYSDGSYARYMILENFLHSCFTLKLSNIFAATAIYQTFRSNNIYSHHRQVHRSWKGPSFSRIRMFKRLLDVRYKRTLLIVFFDTGRYTFPGYKTSFITAYSTLFYMRVCKLTLPKV